MVASTLIPSDGSHAARLGLTRFTDGGYCSSSFMYCLILKMNLKVDIYNQSLLNFCRLVAFYIGLYGV